MGGRRSSLTDLDAEFQAKLIADHEQRELMKAVQSEQKKPSVGIDFVDHNNHTKELEAISIGLSQVSLGQVGKSAGLESYNAPGKGGK